MIEQACRGCHLLIRANVCPNCKRTTLSSDWVGELIVIDPERSVMAKRLDITKPGKYALLVR